MCGKRREYGVENCSGLHCDLPDDDGAASIEVGAKERSFIAVRVAQFNFPWGLAFLPDGHLLVTEKYAGRLFVTTQQEEKTPVINVPAIAGQGQNGLLNVIIAPNFVHNSQIYFIYIEPIYPDSKS